MKLLLAAALLLSAASPTQAQEVAGDAEKDAVKKVVETYLYAEYDDEKQSPLEKEAKIFTADEGGKRIRFQTIRKTSTRQAKGSKTLRSPQKVVSVEVVNDAAVVKVATEFPAGEGREAALPTHVQFISLLKLGGEWKIVSILMPSVARAKPETK